MDLKNDEYVLACFIIVYTGIILCMHPANERWCYTATYVHQ